MEHGLIINQVGRDAILDDVFHEISLQLSMLDAIIVLSADDQSVDTNGHAGAIFASVFQGDLGLAIRAQVLDDTLAAALSQALADLGGQDEGQWHHFGCLIRGITVHHALITSTDLLDLLVDVDGLGDIG